ncbi:helix-turn-helix domain-containing protein [Peptostreptococcus russellii]
MNLSQPSVSIRLKRLEKNNSIEGYFDIVNIT